MSKLKENFGKRLKYLRNQANLTQEELAELSNLSVDFISIVERGISSPSFDSIDSIASALNISVNKLFEFDEKDK